jgi:hypothetical protein
MVANIMMISFPIADFIVTLSLRERRLINAAVVGEFWAPRAVCLDYSHRAAMPPELFKNIWPAKRTARDSCAGLVESPIDCVRDLAGAHIDQK